MDDPVTSGGEQPLCYPLGVKACLSTIVLGITLSLVVPSQVHAQEGVIDAVREAAELSRDREWNAAILLLETARAEFGADPALLTALGDVYRQIRVWEEAIPFYEEATKADPRSVAAWTGFGIASYEAHRPESAKSAFEQVLQLDPSEIEAVGYLGQIALEAGDFEAARRHFSVRLEKEGETFDALTDLAVVYEAAGNRDAARPLLQRAAELHPQVPEAHYNLAVLEGGTGAFHEAVVSANRALVLDPEYLDVLRFLGVLYFERHICNEAVRYFERLLLLAPQDREVRIGLASCLHSLGETDRAVLELKTLINHVGEDYDLLLLIADFRLEQGRLDEALEMTLRALALEETRADAHYLLGLTYRRMGLEDQALREFERLDALREAERLARVPGPDSGILPDPSPDELR